MWVILLTFFHIIVYQPPPSSQPHNDDHNDLIFSMNVPKCKNGNAEPNIMKGMTNILYYFYLSVSPVPYTPLTTPDHPTTLFPFLPSPPLIPGRLSKAPLKPPKYHQNHSRQCGEVHDNGQEWEGVLISQYGSHYQCVNCIVHTQTSIYCIFYDRLVQGRCSLIVPDHYRY